MKRITHAFCVHAFLYVFSTDLTERKPLTYLWTYIKSNVRGRRGHDLCFCQVILMRSCEQGSIY